MEVVRKKPKAAITAVFWEKAALSFLSGFFAYRRLCCFYLGLARVRPALGFG